MKNTTPTAQIVSTAVINYMATPIFLSILMVFLGGCSTIPSKIPQTTNTTITGKLSYRGTPASSVTVSAIPSSEPGFKDVIATSTTTADGTYQLELPQGEYYLFARNSRLFSYFGRNPLRVTESGISNLNMSLVNRKDSTDTLSEPFVQNGIHGRITHQGKPVAGSIIFIYTDLTSQLKGMGYAIAGPTDNEGYFEISLSPGTYYLIARSRQGEATVGPLQAGDLFGYYPDNPIQTSEQGVIAVTIPLLEVPKKMKQSAAALEPTIIRGFITDTEGNGIEGIRAVIYQDPQMFNRPLKVSAPSDSNGMFSLRAPAGGKYYLAARNTLGGAPGPGDLYGTYNETDDHSIQLKKGETLDNLSIIVEEMW